MKKRIMAIVLAFCVSISMLPSMAFAAGEVAEVAGQQYMTLADAVAAAGDGDTVTLLADVPDGSGIIIQENSNLTIDFAGFTYTVTNTPAGSTGTQTQCFQILQGSNVTLKNGAIVANLIDLKMIVQNYANLTLDGVTLDATQGTNDVAYALSNNNGNTTLTGGTTITAKDTGVAFDVYYWPSGSYVDGVSVTVDNATINGKVEYGTDGTAAAADYVSKANLTVNSGAVIAGPIAVNTDNNLTDPTTAAIAVNGGSFSTPVDTAYIADTLTAELKSATNTTTPYTYYPTVEDAYAAAGNGDVVKDLTSTSTAADANVTLQNDTENVVIASKVGDSVTLPTPVKDGYTFLGWDNAGTIVAAGPYTVEGAVTLVAQWEGNPATVNLDDNGSITPITSKIGETIELPTPVKDGYTFLGWDNAGTIVAAGPYTVEGDITLVAQWEGNPADVTLDEANGNAPTVMNSKVGETIELTTPVKDGYTFLGWDNAGTIVAAGPYTVEGAVTLVAQWEGNPADVTLDEANGNEPTVMNSKIGETIELKTPVKDGYTFLGWDNAGTIVAAGPYTVEGAVTLVAQWEGNPAKVTLNDGTAVDAIDSKVGAVIDLPVPTKAGLTFLGWDNAGTIVTSPYTVEGDVTLVAKWEINFSDVPNGAFYEQAVLWAVENGVSNGTSATTFSPDVYCTRADFVTLLWRASGSPEPTATTTPFNDVDQNAYYYKAVLWAVEQGITNGTSATTFSPNSTLNRAQTVTFLWRAKGSPTTSLTSSQFKDVEADSWYEKAVIWALENGVTTGISKTIFGPNSDCTRGQAVTFIYRSVK